MKKVSISIYTKLLLTACYNSTLSFSEIENLPDDVQEAKSNKQFVY